MQIVMHEGSIYLIIIWYTIDRAHQAFFCYILCWTVQFPHLPIAITILMACDIKPESGERVNVFTENT